MIKIAKGNLIVSIPATRWTLPILIAFGLGNDDAKARGFDPGYAGMIGHIEDARGARCFGGYLRTHPSRTSGKHWRCTCATDSRVSVPMRWS